VKKYRTHVFICLGKHCSRKGSERLYDTVKDAVSKAGLKHEIRVSSSGCLRVCKETDRDGEYSPALVFYPEGTWYRNISLDNIDEIIERHVMKGEVVEESVHYKLTP